jgi:hypothetical protein
MHNLPGIVEYDSVVEYISILFREKVELLEAALRCCDNRRRRHEEDEEDANEEAEYTVNNKEPL